MPLKSFDTRGSSQYIDIPFNSPDAAALRAAFISSAWTGLANLRNKVHHETFGVGTRMERR